MLNKKNGICNACASYNMQVSLTKLTSTKLTNLLNYHHNVTVFKYAIAAFVADISWLVLC